MKGLFMKIILLRHGETIWNKERRLQGIQDIDLAEDGILKIMVTAQHIARTYPDTSLILSSPLKRAAQSAGIIANFLSYPAEDILLEPLFLERNFGAGEGMTYEEALDAYPDSNYPGMETLDQLIHRAGCAIAKCVNTYSGHNLLVVAHGAIIKAVLVALTNGKIGYFDEDVWIENASYCLLNREANDWKISFHNASDAFQKLPINS